MKKATVLIIAFVISYSGISQKKNENKYYDLRNNEKSLYGKELISSFYYIPSSEGVITIEFDGQKLEGVVSKMVFETKYSNKLYRKKILRKYLEDYSDMQFSIFDQIMTEDEISPLVGLSVEFEKKGNTYTVVDLEKYSSEIQKELKDEIASMNIKTSSDNYLKKVKLNELIELDKNKVSNMLSFGKLDSGSGTLKIIDVSEVNNDKIATIEVSFKVSFLEGENKDQFRMTFDFNGITKRSLTHNIDLESNLIGTITIEGNVDLDENTPAKMTMITNGKLALSQQFVNSH